MPGFFGDSSMPKMDTVEPRRTIRFSWYYFTLEGDDPLQYFIFQWKVATVEGWTGAGVKEVTVSAENYFYDMPPNTMTLGEVYAWQIVAYVADINYDPTLATSDTNYPGAKNIGGNINLVDASGWILSAEEDAVSTNGANAAAFVKQQVTGFFSTMVPSDPGEYDVRIKVRNGFQWSPWSSIVPVVQYDTRRWVLKSGQWNAVPVYKKTSGTMTEVKT